MGSRPHGIARASFHKCDFLLTWNCQHLANASKFGHIKRVNTKLGLHVPSLVTVSCHAPRARRRVRCQLNKPVPLHVSVGSVTRFRTSTETTLIGSSLTTSSFRRLPRDEHPRQGAHGSPSSAVLRDLGKPDRLRMGGRALGEISLPVPRRRDRIQGR